VRRLLSSPRRRRRLAWAAAGVVAASVGAPLGILYPNTGEKEVFEPGKPVVVPEEPPPTPLPKRDRVTAQRTLSRFVLTAVLREHVGTSYDLVAPSLRVGLTRKDWLTGDIPVPPFPAEAVALIKSKLVYSHRGVARYEVALLTKPNAELLPLLYSIELTRAAQGRRWLVDYAMPLGGGISTRPTPYRQTKPLPNGTGRGRLPLTWVLVPLSILSLIVFVPLMLGARGWLENRRANRVYPRKALPPLKLPNR